MNINIEFAHLLQEGVHDKGIFKAVFLTGGPGSGKDFVLKNALSKHGLVEIGADKAHEYITDKEHNFSKTTPDELNLKKKIKNVSELRQLLALHGRNGVIVNGSGDDHRKTKEIKKGLEKLGYETSMVHVHADDEVSRKRNIERSQKGSRSVSEAQRKKKWDDVQESRRHHAQMFGSNYHEYDNSADLREAHPELVKQKHEELADIHDRIHEFVNTPSETGKSQKWIEKQLEAAQSIPVPRKGTDKLPHPESIASQQAKDSGLSYFGSGRYGKNGKVTHHAINDQLTEIPEKDDKKITPKPKKKLTEIYGNINESVSVTVTGDSVEEVTGLLGKLTGGSDINTSTFSDKSEALTLGKNSKAIGQPNEGVTLTNADIEKILEEEKEEPILDSYGHVKVYLMKPMAQKDAVINEGTVHINPDGRGYIVKVKTKGATNDTKMVNEILSEERREGRREGRQELITSTKEEESNLCEEKQSKQPLTISAFRSRLKESIDRGIEPGLSTASGGEAPLRSDEKTTKKGKVGKIEELTGDETTASIGDQKEDELKKKGIDLSTFKSKKVI